MDDQGLTSERFALMAVLSLGEGVDDADDEKAEFVSRLEEIEKEIAQRKEGK
jgi:hypothetical protein